MSADPRTLLQIRGLAIHAAIKRTGAIPVVGGALTLTTTIKYATSNPEDETWADTDQGDPGRRILVVVRDGKGRRIDSFYACWDVAEVRPCTSCAPCWWVQHDDNA